VRGVILFKGEPLVYLS